MTGNEALENVRITIEDALEDEADVALIAIVNGFALGALIGYNSDEHEGEKPSLAILADELQVCEIIPALYQTFAPVSEADTPMELEEFMRSLSVPRVVEFRMAEQGLGDVIENFKRDRENTKEAENDGTEN